MTRAKVHRNIYIFLLALLLVAMPSSVFFMNLAWVLMLANWVLEWNWREKFAHFRNNTLLHAFLALFAMAMAGLCWSQNVNYGVDYLRRMLPLAAVPLVVLTSEPLRGNHLRRLLTAYVAAVLVVSAIGFVRFLSVPGLPYREIVPFISHIRFALNCCMAIFLLMTFALAPMMRYYRQRQEDGSLSEPSTAREILENLMVRQHVRHFDWFSILCIALTIWLLFFLLLLQSYTAYIVLYFTSLVMLLTYWRRIPTKALRFTALLLWVGVAAAAGVAVGINAYGYYHLSPAAKQPLKATTANGNAYSHAQDGMIENGNYINNWVCRQELAEQWSLRSDKSVDAPAGNGYAIYPALVRYLNAKGLTKDSAGVAQLSPDDIHAIERGVANPVYLRPLSIKRMVYVRLFEYESGRHLHAVKGFTMLQRFDLWRAGWKVFTENPFFGVGTGDVVDALHLQLALHGSELANTNKHTHNQYLSLLMAFGVVGCATLLLLFLRAFVHERMWEPPLLLANLCIVAISFISEDTLETLAGCLFACLFAVLLARQEKKIA
ncbi:MAG: O-antigen ligase family protein [Bacteroidales bacterium]|nr:O-antigen ligase family protein [Bacteroidales bacterium]